MEGEEVREGPCGPCMLGQIQPRTLHLAWQKCVTDMI